MSAQIIDGKAYAQKLRNQIATQVQERIKAGQNKPTLAVVLVGEDPASAVYVRNKGQQTVEVGMNSIEHKLPASTSQSDLITLIENMNNDDTISGILVQLPLPKHIDADAVLSTISPQKDVDGFHPLNVGAISSGLEGFAPCTPVGCIHLAKSIHPSLAGMNAVIVGRSNIVGKPLVQLLLKEDATVTIAHSKSKNLDQICAQADILFVAVGRPEMVKASWIKKGATVIDVGINRIELENGKTKLVGDVDFEACKEVAGAITPVPGGVGPMTIACLLENTLKAAK